VLVVGDPDGDLRYAREEAIAVAKLFRARPWVGHDATRARVLETLRQAGDGLDLLHFSCHGYFDAAQPMRSGIELAANPRSSASDAEATLTVQDIFTLELKGSLVTLSACETGISQQRSGDELVGLTRALLFAGAASVVVSLWAVSDDSSALLMQEYYRCLSDGATRAEALQAAQLHVRGFREDHPNSGDGGTHPYASPDHWAPFILVGDWT
jgi:CHAT domain-containing protein